MTIAIVWFRQDLRLLDNPAFEKACSEHQYVIPLYIYDEKNSVLGEAQAWWLHHSLLAFKKDLKCKGLTLVLRKGNPLQIILELIKQCSIDAVYWNRCYDISSIKRDKTIKATLIDQETMVQSFNGSLLLEPWTIKNKQGNYFKVFTPYWNACKPLLSFQTTKTSINNPQNINAASDDIDDWKLLPTRDWAARFTEFWTPGEIGAQHKLTEFVNFNLNHYKVDRDFPNKLVTSRLSPHLHFGEISPSSILEAIELAKLDPVCNLSSADNFISELGWREFSYYLLYHFPRLPYDNFKSEFNAFPWNNDKYLLSCWQKGITGYPIVDAGMRELWITGTMHNRVRMIVASFLTKGLLIDWRLGAQWFLDTLLDADLANNSVSWQWVAGCGADAAPYFRIFNPVLQSQKFDAEGDYIRRWVPELAGLDKSRIHAPWEAPNSASIYTATKYPRPIIEHQEARARALACYKELKK